MDEQAPDFGQAGQQPPANEPGGELKRDRRALRTPEPTGGEESARKSFFSRSSRRDSAAAPTDTGADATPEPVSNEAAPGESEFGGVEALFSSQEQQAAVPLEEPFSSFAALNLDEPAAAESQFPFTALPEEVPVPKPTPEPRGFTAPVFDPAIFDAPGIAPESPAVSGFEPPLTEPPLAEQPRFTSATAELPDFDVFESDGVDDRASEPAPYDPAPASSAPVGLATGEAFPAEPSPAESSPYGSFATQAAPPSDAGSVPPSGGAYHPTLGPLQPRVVEPPAEIRSLDIAAIVAAVVLPPIGLVLAIVAIVRGNRYRGWASNLARAAVVVSIVMSLVFAAAGGYFMVEQAKQAQAQAELDAIAAARASVVAESAEFCAAVAANPTIFASEDPDFGWPALDDPSGYLPAIRNYSALWQSFVPLAPSGIAPQVESFSTRITGVVDVAASLQANNRAGDLLGVHSNSDISTIAAYVVEYCE